MANCISCGRPLARTLFGQSSSVCADCRNTAVTVPVSASIPTSTPEVPQPRPITRSYPPVTTALVGINVAVYLAMVVSGISPLAPQVPQLLRWGANWGPLSLGPQPWRILVSNYLHGGLIHIALNMWCLWNLGILAERIFDAWTYLLTYTVCGLAGSLLSLWWHPNVVGVGASGAIFGLAGALIAALYLGHLPIPKAAMRGTLRSLVTFAAYNLFFGALPGIDNSAHIGGLLAGLALGAVMAKHLMSPPEVRKGWRRAVFTVAILMIFMLFSVIRRANTYVPPPGTLNSGEQTQGALFRVTFIRLLPRGHVGCMPAYRVSELLFLLRGKCHPRRFSLPDWPRTIGIAISIRVAQAFLEDRFAASQLGNYRVDSLSVV